MSWDIFIMDLPKEAQDVSELPKDFKVAPLGQRSELITAIQAAAPMADFTDPSWGQIVTPDFVIEVNIGREEQVDSIMLHVRGGGDSLGLISEILNQLNARADTTTNARALDMQTGELFDPTAAAQSLAAWRAFRDRVIGQHG